MLLAVNPHRFKLGCVCGGVYLVAAPAVTAVHLKLVHTHSLSAITITI